MNPLSRLKRWLNAEDLEEKLFQWDYGNPAIALRYGTLIHGPGATELLSGGEGRDSNSAVFACLMAISTAFFEAPLRVFRVTGPGEREWLPEHPLQSLLDRPNPWMNPQELWFWSQWSLQCDGNAYLYKIRSGSATSGNVLEVWPLSPRVLTPMTARGSNDFISFYRRDLGSGRFEDIPPENIVHLKLGIDDRDHRVGISPLKRLVRQVSSDEEAARFADALLHNFAVPGTVVTTPPGVSMTREEAEALKERIQQAYGTDNRGNTGVLTNGATMERIGFSPQELDLKVLHQIPETRICAVLRVPPAVDGLSVGLEQTSNYASLRVVFEGFTERTLIPLWSLTSAKINQQLLPDFSSDRKVECAFDLSDVRSLQEDENAKWTRLDTAVKGKWITVNEARADVGLPPVDGGDELNLSLPEPAAEEMLGEPNEGPPSLQVVKQARMLPPERKQLTTDDLPRVYQAMLALAQPAFEKELAAYQDSQRKRIKRRLLAGGGG